MAEWSRKGPRDTIHFNSEMMTMTFWILLFTLLAIVAFMTDVALRNGVTCVAAPPKGTKPHVPRPIMTEPTHVDPNDTTVDVGLLVAYHTMNAVHDDGGFAMVKLQRGGYKCETCGRWVVIWTSAPEEE